MSGTQRKTAYICLGETDEWHPFCPFATYDREKANEHSQVPGHWCGEEHAIPEGMWADSLRAEVSS